MAGTTVTLRSFSYGGGVQSTAALVLAAQGDIDFPLFLFANVGAESENPATLDYVHDEAMPYAARHGIELVELERHKRDGSVETLMGRIRGSEKSIPIPVRMGESGAPGNRTCTSDFKIKVIGKELRRRGATKDDPAAMGLGISLDEWQRAKTADDPRTPYQRREYPLLEMRLTRQDCLNIIAASELPTPERSSCFYCPFHSNDEWQRLARKRPDLFAKAAELEKTLFERGRRLGRGDFYLTRYGKPLDQVFNGDQEVLFEDGDDGCESGYCMT
jgi:hypothetical protein